MNIYCYSSIFKTIVTNSSNYNGLPVKMVITFQNEKPGILLLAILRAVHASNYDITATTFETKSSINDILTSTKSALKNSNVIANYNLF